SNDIIQKQVVICLFAILFGCIKVNAQSINANRESVKVFRAGASTSNITPELGKGIVGNFGTPPPAEYIHDELHARSLVLDDGTTQLIFVIVDNVGINREV